jgi:hypothetical protein
MSTSKASSFSKKLPRLVADDDGVNKEPVGVDSPSFGTK